MNHVDCLPRCVEAQGVLVVLVVQWAVWEAEVETGEASPQEDHGVLEETLLEGMSSTELETGSAPTRDVETRTLPGEQSVINARLLNQKAFFHLPSHLQVEIVAEVALVA